MAFGPSLVTFGWVLEPSGGSGGPSWEVLGAIVVVWRATLGGLMGHLGGLEGLLEALGGHLGSLEGYLGDLEGHLGAKKAAKGQNLDFAMVFAWFLVRA